MHSWRLPRFRIGRDASVNKVSPVPDPPIERVSADTPLKCISVDPAFRTYVGRIPPGPLNVPSMISPAEKRVLYGLAERYYRGDGIIVDAGIFLGASTRCFGEGLQNNARLGVATALKSKPIVSFEKGDVNPSMPAFFKRNRMDNSLVVGETFFELLHENIKEVKDLVELREGDITADELPLDYPIEICFLDVLKLPSISTYCIKRFYPKLIPGRSIVLQQDYFYERLPYIKTHQEFLRDHFDFIGEVGSTGIWRLASAIPPATLDALDTIERGEQLRLASIAMQRSKDPYRRLLMAFSKARLIGKLHGKEEAGRYLDFVRADFPEQVANREHRRVVEAVDEIEIFCGR